MWHSATQLHRTHMLWEYLHSKTEIKPRGYNEREECWRRELKELETTQNNKINSLQAKVADASRTLFLFDLYPHALIIRELK